MQKNFISNFHHLQLKPLPSFLFMVCKILTFVLCHDQDSSSSESNVDYAAPNRFYEAKYMAYRANKKMPSCRRRARPRLRPRRLSSDPSSPSGPHQGSPRCRYGLCRRWLGPWSLQEVHELATPAPREWDEFNTASEVNLQRPSGGRVRRLPLRLRKKTAEQRTK